MKRLLQQLGEKGSRYDPDAILYFNQLTGSLPISFKNAVNTYVRALKTAGIWTQLDRLWLHATPNQQNARISIVNPTSTPITEVNAPTWTANLGYTGNGATAYLNHNIRESDLTNYTLNSSSIFLYCRSNVAENVNEYGVYDAGAGPDITACIINSGAFYYMANNIQVADVSYSSNLNSLGFFMSKRINATDLLNYKNAILLQTQTGPAQSLLSLNIYSLARNDSFVAAAFSSKQHALIGYGSGSIDKDAMNTATQALAVALGFNV